MITTTQTETSVLKADYNRGYVWLISIVAAMGGLLFGWDWVVIGGAKPFFQRYFELTSEAQIGWANSCALLGCLVGALIAGALSDKFGRKRLLIVAALLFTVTSLGDALAHNFTIFIAWRILGGVAIGLASNLSPMYIAEIAPAQIRGKLVSINQLTIVIGILLAQYINWFLVRDLPAGATDEFIRNSWYGQQGWRWMFGVTAVPSLLFFFGMLLVPESPRWLAKKGESDRARGILTKIGGEPYANAAVADIESTLASEETQRVRFAELLEPKMRNVLVLGVVLAVFQQWCGINVIFNYAEEIFRAAGYDISTVLKEHRMDRISEFGLHLRGARSRGSWRAATTDVVRFGGAGDHLYRDGLLLQRRRQRAADAAAGTGGNRLLRDVPRTGDVGGYLGNFPESHSRHGHVCSCVSAVDREFHPHLHVPNSEREPWAGGNVLALRRDLRCGICIHQTQAAGNQGQIAGTDRTGVGGLS